MEEEFKIIPFEDGYEISNKGRVRNVYKGNILKSSPTKDGYRKITLYPSWKSYSVHRLVAKVWLADTYEEGLQTDHLNGIRDDNNVSNLEWVTLQENVRRIKNRHRPVGIKNVNAVINDEIAMTIKYSFSETNKDISERLSISVGIVESVRRREKWTHVRDNEKEGKWLKGELTYAKGKTANLSKEDGYKLDIDLLSGEYNTKTLTAKYNVSKSSVCRRRRNLKTVEKSSTTIP